MQSQKYCTSKGHENKEALNFCDECKIYICKTCENMHSQLLPNHNIKLEYYCKNHNKLCCSFCATKIEGKGNGQHNKCDICFIEDIKEDKRNNLKNNIKLLEELSN